VFCKPHLAGLVATVISMTPLVAVVLFHFNVLNRVTEDCCSCFGILCDSIQRTDLIDDGGAATVNDVMLMIPDVPFSQAIPPY
jgi:hypothetical protein